MASTLPHNILSYIGTFIKEEDRSHCAIVCKHWKEPFLNAYWGKLKINSNTTNITEIISKSLLINAHRVWAVEFPDVHLNDYESLLEFQRSFPGIRYVEFYDYIPRVFPISDVFDWRLWQSLTHINIRFSHDSETRYLDNLFLKLSVLPCLVHLALYKSKQITFSWNDFESLHYHLPRLEYIEHDFPFESITRDEIKNIKTVEPAQTMARIEFNDDIDTLWLFYFASKYPNLRHFTIQEFYDTLFHASIKYSDEEYQTGLQLLSTLDQFFPCLKRAVTLLRDKNMYSWFLFYETLGHFGTKIEHVKLKYGYSVKGDDISRCIQPISQSLKVLEIYLYTREVMRFHACSRLVTLYIYGWDKLTITAETILECFPGLRSLYVRKVDFSLSTNTHTYTSHPLQKLKIEDSDINNDALHYLSLCCSQLKHVTLIDIRYNEVNTYDYDDETNGEPGKWIFDMSMSNLDTFIFTFTDELLHELRDFPRHYMIEQMETNNDILQPQQSSRINWYHLYCDRTNRKKKVLEWELGKRDIEFCQRYFKDFARRIWRGKDRKDVKQDDYGFVQKRFWKKDLRYGVFVFRFKSVKSHIFRIRCD